MKYINIAIIAHVDHWKTTLVDALLKQSGTFWEHENVEERVMDSNAQEKERWITIYSKNTSVQYKDYKINIVDTPWHADFWSEVERVLRMIDSVVLIVDAYEWPMPQTKFVLRKSLELWLKPIVVINKIDKPTARIDYVIDNLFDLFVQLNASDEQLDFPIVYTIARDWIAKKELKDESSDIYPLLDTIIEKVEEKENVKENAFRMQIANLAYDNFLWRLWIWRIYEWTLKQWQDVVIIWNDGKKRKWKISELLTNQWLKKVKTKEAYAWDIVTIAWIADIYIWETICENDNLEALPSITIDEPTLKMEFLVNNSPFAWKEGKFVTWRQIRDRLEKELETNVWLKIDFDSWENYIVSWRWELHLSVLIESMRREWFELQVWAPQVIFKEKTWVKYEPIERVAINLPSEFAWSIIEKLWKRKWEMLNMKEENGITNMEFFVPTRWLLWFKWEFTTLTKWEWILTSSFEKYDIYKWDIEKREVWSMIAWEAWTAMAYSLWKLQERWPIFIDPAIQIYEWMIIWEHLKWWDLTVNATKNKQLTNIRASWTDEALRLVPPRRFTLESALDYISNDEYVEITPQNIRLRKKYLTENDRKKHSRESD